MEFAGRYPDNLHEEINNFSIIAGVVARQQEFDIIHAHDWLTYPAGVHAKMVSGNRFASMYMLLILTVLAAKSILLFILLRRTGWIMLIVSCAYPNLLVALLLTYHQDPRRYLLCIMLFIHCLKELLDIPRPEHPKEKGGHLPRAYYHAERTGILCGGCCALYCSVLVISVL